MTILVLIKVWGQVLKEANKLLQFIFLGLYLSPFIKDPL